jgi:hypothetical protein
LTAGQEIYIEDPKKKIANAIQSQKILFSTAA